MNVFTFDGRKRRIVSVSIADVTKDCFLPLHPFLVSHNEKRKRSFGTADNFKK